MKLYHKTGQHLGQFKDEASANAYAEKLHQAQAAMLKGQGDGTVRSTVDENTAMYRASLITDAAVREKAESRISFFYNKKAAADRVSQEAAAFKGYTIMEHNGWDTSSIPQSLRTSMGLSHWENLVTASRVQLNQDAKGGPGDPEQYQTLLNEAYFNPEQFSSRNILEVKGLNTAQTSRLQNLQRSVGDRMQRDEERSIVSGMNATTKAIKAGDLAPADTASRDPLNADPALDKALHAGTPSAPLTVPGKPAQTQTTPFTPSMLRDAVAKAGTLRNGVSYPDYLRHMGVDVPDNIDALIAAEQAKASAAAKAKKAKP